MVDDYDDSEESMYDYCPDYDAEEDDQSKYIHNGS